MRDYYLKLIRDFGTPLLIIDHDKINDNYLTFSKNLPDVKCYYAVKANPTQQIIETLYNSGSNFDVASYNEFLQVMDVVKNLDADKITDFVKNRMIFSNTIKDRNTLKNIQQHQPLMTFDNIDELVKIKEYCENAELLLRLKVPDSGSLVELGSKFGAEVFDADKLLCSAKDMGLKVKGISFHVGSQCLNFDNFSNALEIAADVLYNSGKLNMDLKIVDIGGGFPAMYHREYAEFIKLSNIIKFECNRLFSEDIEFISEPGRFLVSNSAVLITEIIGKSIREGKLYYHINDGIYGSFANVLHDHFIPNFTSFHDGHEDVCAVVGPTCDSFDKVSMSAILPTNLNIGDYLITNEIGAYSISTTTKFNGFDGPKVVNITAIPIQ